MTTEDLVKYLLGGGFLTSLAAWWASRHKPRVDQAQLVISGSKDLIDELQEERDALKAERKELKEEREAERRAHREKVAEQDAKIEKLTHRVTEAEDVARDAKTMTTYAVAENASLTSYILATARGIAAGHVPPWLDPRDYDLHARLSLDDFPVVPVRRYDTGTPGVDVHDVNPPTDSGTTAHNED